MAGIASNQLIKNLREFNRKERYYVVANATEGGFTLAEEFKKMVNHILPTDHQIGSITDAFVAMDYHLDWIYASLVLASQRERKDYLFDMPNEDGQITASQEDVDLIIAYPDKFNTNKSHLIMFEAKGDTSWTNKQAESKAQRLKSIFGAQNEKWSNIVVPHYIIWSPKVTKLKAHSFPDWAKDVNGCLHWLELPMKKGAILKKIVRRNKKGNKYLKWEVVSIN